MEISQTYVSMLRGMFSSAEDVIVRENPLIIKLNNAFNRFFTVDISSDKIEVPIFARSVIEDTVTQNLIHDHLPDQQIKKVVVPLYTNCISQKKRTSDSIIKEFFTKTDFTKRLQKIITNKGEVYYGGRGIIMDKDFNILILYTLKCKKVNNNGHKEMSYYKPIIHIGPQVFLNQGLVEKAIVNKIIPWYITHGIVPPTLWSRQKFVGDITRGTKVQILIDDMSQYIMTPNKPSPQQCSQEVLNQILIDNIDEIIELMYV